MSQEKKTELGIIDAPYNRQVKLEAMDLGNNVQLIRLTIKEGSRFTQLDLDPGTARDLAQNIVDWADKHTQD